MMLAANAASPGKGDDGASAGSDATTVMLR